MTESTKQIVEINGVKLEIDTRYARRIEELKVGSRVKVLIKGYSDNWDAWSGVVVGFEPFPDRPTIIVAYIETSYNKAEMKLLHWHKGTKDHQIIAALDDDFTVTKGEVLGWFDREEQKKLDEIAEIKAKRTFFLDRFKAYWADINEEPQHAV